MARWSLHKKDWQDWQCVHEGAAPGEWYFVGARLDSSGFLPVEDASVQKLALLLAPNRLSMATFYMFLAEARRAVPAGGAMALVTKDAPLGFWETLKSFWHEMILGQPGGLRPEHYVSPEHWQHVRAERKWIRGVPVAIAEFRRTSFS